MTAGSAVFMIPSIINHKLQFLLITASKSAILDLSVSLTVSWADFMTFWLRLIIKRLGDLKWEGGSG